MREVLREEKKFELNIERSTKLNNLLDKVMLSDIHNGPKGYLIRSLYFDTIDDRDYQDKVDGLEIRRKIRLRTYENADYAMLEMKQKSGKYQRKRSLKLNKNDAIELCKANYSVLLKYSDPFAIECYSLMNMKCYRPKTIVEYKRMAYIAKENRIRITLDSEIKATESDFNIFSNNLNTYKVLDDFKVVLEVKYNGFLLSYIKNLLDSVKCSEISVSKYCLARKISMHY